MKKYSFLVLIVVLAAATAWAEPRMIFDQDTGETGVVLERINGEVSGEVVTLVLGELSVQTPLDGDIFHVAWDFGDGSFQARSPSSNSTYTHAYVQSGTFIVTLYVIDDAGSRRARNRRFGLSKNTHSFAA
ncbi:MAG: PKD domain-containing protein [Candidatus Atribacteria bacterium]|nr:MAG: PKD domain-containing protein [Candidatus Atribacteria bacterium]